MYDLRLQIFQFQWVGASDANGSCESEMAFGRGWLSRIHARVGTWASVGSDFWMEDDLEFLASLCSLNVSRSISLVAKSSVGTIKRSQRKKIGRDVYI